MFSICKSEWKKSSFSLPDLEPLKYYIAERTMARDTLVLIQKIALEYLSPFLFAIDDDDNNNNNNNNSNNNNDSNREQFSNQTEWMCV